VVFILFEQRAAQPMLPLSLFKVRNFTVGNLATLAIYAGLAVSSFILTITLQQVGGYSALAAGLAMLPVTFLMFFLSSRFGALAGRYGPRIFMTLGPLTAAVGFLLMLHLQLPVHYLSDLLPGILVFGLGLSITVAPLTSAVLGDIAPRHAGVASAVNNAVARVAGLVAVAFVGVITGTQLVLVGYRRVLVIVAGLLAVGGIISLLGIRTSTASSEVAEPISSEAS
jgi:MFS family permease